MAKTTRVVIADGHEFYREGLRGVLAKWDDFDVVGEASDGREAVDLCRRLSPDILIMDASMPTFSGVEAAAAIHAERPEVLVVMLCTLVDEEEVVAAAKGGVKGILLKNVQPAQLRRALSSILNGNAVLSDEVSSICLDIIQSRFVGAVEDRLQSSKVDMLSDHERQVLRLVARGASNKEIGMALYVGESTVKKQLSAILTKLELENRVQAAVFALRMGLAE